ncbi:hypothetical protein [Raineyella sp.]|nr:hypothetical protein [Raineyella sp.]MEA5153339.1 hypothetical protein [Raineyella sp.]
MIIGGARTRQLCALFDVAATSLLTLTLSLAAARTLGVADFGRYGISVTVASIVLSLVQGGLIDYQLRRHRDLSSAAFWGVERWFPVAAVVGVALGVVAYAMPAGAVDTGVGTLVYVAMGAVIVYLYARTYWVRAYLTKASREMTSLAISGTNLALAAGLVTLLLRVSSHGWLPLLWVHLASMGLTGIVGHRILAGRRSGDTVGSGWNMAYAWENLALVSAMQISSVVAAPRLGLSFNAGLRGASTLLGPLNVLFGGARLTLLPRMARSPRSRQLLVGSSAALSLAGLGWVVILYWLLVFAGPAVLGDSWQVTRDMLPWVGATYVTQGAYLAAFIHARAVVLDSVVRSARVVQLGLVVLGTAVAMVAVDWRIYVAGNALANVVAFLMIFSAGSARASVEARGGAQP